MNITPLAHTELLKAAQDACDTLEELQIEFISDGIWTEEYPATKALRKVLDKCAETKKPKTNPIQALVSAHHAVGRLWESWHDGHEPEDIAECDCDLCEAANSLDIAVRELTQ